MTTKPLAWMRLLRDAEPKRTTRRLAVLYSLALRMRPDGTGFASSEQLANDAGVHRATVTRATVAEREAGYLVRTRRGHRIDERTVLASEWRLTQPATGDRFGASQRRTGASLGWDPKSQTGGPKVANDGPNVADRASPRGLPPTSARPKPTALTAPRKATTAGGWNHTNTSRTRGAH